MINASIILALLYILLAYTYYYNHSDYIRVAQIYGAIGAVYLLLEWDSWRCLAGLDL